MEWDLMRLDRIIPAQPPEGSAWRRQKLALLDDMGNAHELKYWYEVSRLQSVGKIGNLLLYRPAGPGAAQLASADFEDKAAYYRQCGVEAMLPAFSGAVVSGRYRWASGRWRVCSSSGWGRGGRGDAWLRALTRLTRASHPALLRRRSQRDQVQL
jgi:hypothetical protein